MYLLTISLASFRLFVVTTKANRRNLFSPGLYKVRRPGIIGTFNLIALERPAFVVETEKPPGVLSKIKVKREPSWALIVKSSFKGNAGRNS